MGSKESLPVPLLLLNLAELSSRYVRRYFHKSSLLSCNHRHLSTITVLIRNPSSQDYFQIIIQFPHAVGVFCCESGYPLVLQKLQRGPWANVVTRTISPGNTLSFPLLEPLPLSPDTWVLSKALLDTSLGYGCHTQAPGPVRSPRPLTPSSLLGGQVALGLI